MKDNYYFRGRGYINKPKKYQCNKCKKYFRLKQTLREHKCINGK